MTWSHTAIVCCLAFCLRCEVLANAEPPAVLLERAVQAQDTRGDLDEAIGLYKRITQESEASRATVAEAYYRLGVCLQKKNLPQEARQAFETLIQQYADQKNMTAKARVQLSKLMIPQSAVPVVVRTTPPAFANDVPADLKEIAVTFNQTMMNESWSWTTIGEETFPKLPGKPSYDAGRKTARLPVELEPGKVYWVGVNSPSQNFFQTPQRVAARPYVILFATGDEQGQPTTIPADLLAKAKAINDPPTSQPGDSAVSVEAAMAMLDEETRAQIQDFERQFASWFQKESAYQAASPEARAALVEQWTAEAKADDFKTRTRAIAALGNVAVKEAVPVLLQVAQEPMSNHRPKWMAVRGLGRIGDRSAVPTLIEFIDHGNTNVRVYSRLALARIAGVYLGESKETWREWWDKQSVKTSPADKRASERHAVKGWSLWNQQKFAEAEPHFRQATLANPGNANAWQGLGWSQMNQGLPLNAKMSFERCLAVEPGNAAALNGLGWIAKGQGNVQEAIDYWKKAVDASPDATAALAGLSRTLMEENRFKEAQQYFAQWLKAEPNNAEAKNGLAEAKSRAAARDDARKPGAERE